MTSALRLFFEQHITCAGAPVLINFILIVGVALVSAAAYYICKWLLTFVEHVVRRSPTRWDDDLLNSRQFKAISQLAPALVVRNILPGLFATTPATLSWLSSLTSLYIVFAAVYAVVVFFDNLYNAMLHREKLKIYAVKGIFQMVKLLIIALGVIVGLSILIGRSPVAIITALGASAAVLSLVFKDTIMGLVASVQLTANNMLHRGDWIVVDKHGANGEVIDITLTTVKVLNWDKSVQTIPPYSLVSDSFRNYEPMVNGTGRRVDRAVYIDVNTVGFVTAEKLEELRADGMLDGIGTAEARHTVNLSLLRRYLENHLSNDPRVNPDMTLMVRQLEPTPSGLPLQLYFFTRTTAWTEFEAIQADIFDHVYATVRHFGLAIFQTPAGRDIKGIGDR